MNDKTQDKYFDLQTTGVGDLVRVQEPKPEAGGSSLLTVTIAALRGRTGQIQYTYFECDVVGSKAQAMVRELQSAVEGGLKVLVGFTLSNLHLELGTYQGGERDGQVKARLKGRLLRISYAKVDGQPFVIGQAAQ